MRYYRVQWISVIGTHSWQLKMETTVTRIVNRLLYHFLTEVECVRINAVIIAKNNYILTRHIYNLCVLR